MKLGMGNVEGFTEMAPPKMVTGVHYFLGATRFYCRFIKGCTKIAQLLDELISWERSKLKNQPVKMTPEALEALNQLKMKCMMAPVLAFSDFKQPFRLETDTLKDGLGTVLSQKQSDSKSEMTITAMKLCSTTHDSCYGFAADADGYDSMRSNPTIAALNADGLVERDTMGPSVVSQELSYGLSLAAFRTMVSPSTTTQAVKLEHHNWGWCRKELAK